MFNKKRMFGIKKVIKGICFSPDGRRYDIESDPLQKSKSTKRSVFRSSPLNINGKLWILHVENSEEFYKKMFGVKDFNLMLMYGQVTPKGSGYQMNWH